MTRLASLLCTALFAAAGPLARAAETAGADKSGYTLARPTPAALLREMSTDRPDTTESPFTVDAGHVQIELDAAAFTRDRLGGVRTTELAIAPFNVRLGLLNHLEAGIFFDPFVEQTERAPGEPRSRVRGTGDTTLRLKINFWGNDGGVTACGVIADVKLPTATRALGNGKVEGALTLPFACELGGGWEAGANTSIAAVHDGYRHRPVWGNTFTVSRSLTEAVGAFAEITSTAGSGPHVCTFDIGVAWRLDPNAQIDAGVNLGVSRSAPDATWFAGLSRRF